MRSAAEALAKAVQLGEDSGTNCNPRAFVSPSVALIVYDPVSRVGRKPGVGDSYGNKESYRGAHGGACARTSVGAADFPGRPPSRLRGLRHGAAGHADEETNGCARSVQRCRKELQSGVGTATCADRFEATAAEAAGA